MPIDNNPSYKLAQENYPHLVKDIQENGQLGTAGQRILSVILKAIIKDSFFFNVNTKKLQGHGARINKLRNFTRKGGRDKKFNNDGDFLGMAQVNFLSENILIDKFIETEFYFDKFDLRDTEAGNMTILSDMFNASLFQEIDIEMEKRFVNTLLDAIYNGVEGKNDQAITANAPIFTSTISYANETQTKVAIKTIKAQARALQQLDNPLVYKPKLSNYVLLVNTELDDAIQDVGAYEVFGGDKTYQNFLGNKPTKLLKDTIQVLVLQELPNDIPYLFGPKTEAFNNLSPLITQMPQGFDSRMDFLGKSTTEMFFRSTSEAFGYQPSYGSAKAGVGSAGINADAVATGSSVAFVAHDPTTGDVDVVSQITSSQDAADFAIDVFDDQFNVISSTAPTLVDGTPETVSLTNLKPGTYYAAIRFTNQVVYTSAQFMISNKAYVPTHTGVETNKSLKYGIKIKDVKKEYKVGEVKAIALNSTTNKSKEIDVSKSDPVKNLNNSAVEKRIEILNSKIASAESEEQIKAIQKQISKLKSRLV